MTDKAPWQKIVKDDRRFEESASVSGKNLSYVAREVHYLTLECGHRILRRGSSVPKTRVRCSKCLAKEPVPKRLKEPLLPKTTRPVRTIAGSLGLLDSLNAAIKTGKL